MPTNNDPSPESFDDATLPPRQSLPAVAGVDEFATMNPVHTDEEATLAPRLDDDATILPIRETQSQSAAGARVRYFGDYELLSEIARGGMGVVYKARQVNLNRIVALKMILAGQLASEEEVQRFRTEAEAAANLDHPGIVPIFEIGQHDGQHFFSMGYVDGCSLADRVRNGPLPPKEAAELTKKVAEAIAFAHSRNVIHRDLKPANVLLDQNGEPKVTDFGLARKTDTNSGMTRTGAVMGTPSYMPPEQAAGKTNEVGPLSDVYSLGAILYCLLTGRPPFQAASPIDTLMQVIEQDPVDPYLLNHQVDRELSSICMKSLEKTPSDRYGSALAVADDLRRYLDGEDISIPTRRSLTYFWRSLDRHRDARQLATWGSLLTVFAVIVFVAEAIIWPLAIWESEIRQVYVFAGLVRFVQLMAMFAATWKLRSHLIASRSSVSRLMWTQWAGFLIGCNLFFIVKLIGLRSHPMSQIMLECYPGFSILSGILWFSLGSNFWGYCYLFGFVFFATAIVVAFFPEFGPLCFGLLWSIFLFQTGRRLRRISAEIT